MNWISYVLPFLCIHYGYTSSSPDKRELDEDSQYAASLETPLASVSSHIPTRHTISEYQTRVAIPVPQAVPVSVPRPVPYPVHYAVPVDHPRPVPVPVPHPVAHIIPRPYAVPIDRPFPYPIAHPVPVTITQGVNIPVPQPYAIPVASPVPVRVPVPVPAGVVVGGIGNPNLIPSGYGVGLGSGLYNSGSQISSAVVSAHGHQIQHPY